MGKVILRMTVGRRITIMKTVMEGGRLQKMEKYNPHPHYFGDIYQEGGKNNNNNNKKNELSTETNNRKW